MRTMLQLLACASVAAAFSPTGPATTRARTAAIGRPAYARRCAGARLGLFDRLKQAFENEDFTRSPAMYEQTNARASHILVPTEAQAEEIKAQLADGSILFDEAATKYSTCNSARQGGRLGKFVPGQMVQEFDDVVFSVVDNGASFEPKYALDEVHGPVKTKFGYHLIKITQRTMADFDFRAQEAVRSKEE